MSNVYEIPTPTSISQIHEDALRPIGPMADSIAAIIARRAIRKHRERAAGLRGAERLNAIAEANAIAAKAGLIHEGEIAA